LDIIYKEQLFLYDFVVIPKNLIKLIVIVKVNLFLQLANKLYLMYYIIFPILWLLSLLPFWVLYRFADLCYVVLYYIVGYRKPIVIQNLAIAFPEKSAKERTEISKQFYKNLVDTFFESIKFITISKATLNKRSTGEYDAINKLVAEGKNIHIMAGHQFNWEFANLLYSANLSIPFIGVYMPIGNKVLDKIFFNFRKKCGTILIAATDFKNKMHKVFNQQYALALAADQNPGNPNNAYWVHFFGKPAPFVTGPAKGAVKHNTALAMIGFKKIKRGQYHFSCNILTEDSASYTPQQLTILYKNALEQVIKNDPANYLWSHRRWKYDYLPAYGALLD
jgi:Kdo2-lipid IVA lauroyltransferase/acyltransferase